MQPIMTYLAKWNKGNDSLAKLQSTYAVLAFAMLLLAGLVSLINQNLGQSILFLAFVLLLTFIGNGIIWSLLRTFVVPHVEASKPTTTRKK